MSVFTVILLYMTFFNAYVLLGLFQLGSHPSLTDDRNRSGLSTGSLDPQDSYGSEYSQYSRLDQHNLYPTHEVLIHSAKEQEEATQANSCKVSVCTVRPCLSEQLGTH